MGSPVPATDLVCIQNAVTKRDNAVISAWDKFTPAVRTALVARRDALVVAWAKTDRQERRTAIRSAWDAYRKAVKDARATLKSDRKAAWEQYGIDRKACKVNKKDDTGSMEHDNLL